MDSFTGPDPPPKEMPDPTEVGSGTGASGEAKPELAPDSVQTKAFLHAAENGSLQLASIDPQPDEPVHTHIVNGNAEATRQWVEGENLTRNIYFQPNPVVPGLNSKARKTDIAAAVCAQVDIDPPKDGTPFDAEAVRAQLVALPVPPSSINFTGGGVQALWYFTTPTDDFRRVEALSRGIAVRFGGDHCFAINHLMRVPGTINWPTPKKIAAGRKPTLARIMQPHNGRRYSLDELEAEFQPVAEEPPMDRGDSDFGDYELLSAADLGHTDRWDALRIVIDEPAGADGSRDALLCAGDMMRAGYSKEQVLGVLMNPANAVHAHLSRQTNPLRTALRIISKVWARTAEDGAGAQAGAEAGSTTGSSAEHAGGASTGGRNEPLDLIDPAEWTDVALEPRKWVLKDYIPADLVTLFTGTGSVGKSLAGQQIATAVATGKPFLSIPTAETVSAYMTFEDDERELHGRQIAICNVQNVHLSDLRGRLFLASLAGAREKGMVRVDQHNRMSLTPLFERVKLTLQKHSIGFLIIDNVAHIFEANEIVRAHVAAGLGALHALALETGSTIVLIAHPNKQGDSYSGSTAWQNQVRSQIALDRDSNDRDRRLLKRVKANYAGDTEEVAVRWHNGAFIREDEVDTETQKTYLERLQDDRFLVCLNKRNEQKRPVSDKSQARNSYAPVAFEGMPEAHDMKASDFEKAMKRLMDRGQVAFGELDYKDAHRHKAVGLYPVAQDGGDDEPF